MANEQNLIKYTSEQSREKARENGRKGGIASGEAKRARKTLKEELLALLAEDQMQERISIALLQKAQSGDTKAFEVIRDTIGEKPKDEVALETDGGIAVNIRVEE